MSKELKLKYKKTFNDLKQIINSCDPWRLIEIGAPEDEYESEITKILVGLLKCNSVDDATKLVAEVFGECFEKENISMKNCQSVGEKIYYWYKDFNSQNV